MSTSTALATTSNVTDPSTSARPTRTPTAPDPFVFPGGDVELLMTYKGKAITALVSSHVLVCASHVWRNFLFPPVLFPSPPTTVPKQIDCSQDDGEALLLVLNLIHLRYRSIPKHIDQETLFQVALLCDQYDCVNILKPWLREWMKETESDIVAKNFISPSMLFACWVYGEEETFDKLARKLALELCVDEEGSWRRKRGWLVTVPDTMPAGIMESILRVRLQTIDDLLAVPFSAIARFKRTKTVLCQMSQISSHDSQCDAVTLGSIERGLDIADLPYGTTAEDVQMSVEEVAAAIDDIHVYYLDANAAHSRANHGGCHPRGFEDGVAKALRIMESPVLDAHREHMRVQQTKL